MHDHHERVTVTVHGRPPAVLVAIEDLERLKETLAIMVTPNDAPTRKLGCRACRRELVSAAELAEVIRRRSAHE